MFGSSDGTQFPFPAADENGQEEDERIKQRAGGMKRELRRYLSPGTHRKT